MLGSKLTLKDSPLPLQRRLSGPNLDQQALSRQSLQRLEKKNSSALSALCGKANFFAKIDSCGPHQ